MLYIAEFWVFDTKYAKVEVLLGFDVETVEQQILRQGRGTSAMPRVFVGLAGIPVWSLLML